MGENDIFEELKNEKKKSEKKKNRTSEIDDNERDNKSQNNNTQSDFTIDSKENKNRIQRSFYITPQLDRELEKLKAKTGRDKSELVRIALKHMVKNAKVKK